MKKFLSLTLALLLILSMTATAFADDDAPEQGEQTEQWDGTYTSTTPTTFEQIVKTYDSEKNVAVNETLTFTSEYNEDNPDVVVDSNGNVTNNPANLTVEDLTVNSLTQNTSTGKYEAGNLKVTIPSLSKAGTYEWTITENEGNTAGVGYSEAAVVVTALVEYDNVSHKLQIASCTSYIKKVNGAKANTFENTFKSGSFTVEKDVIGNMANENDEFDITVTLTSANPIGNDITVGGNTVVPNAWTPITDDNNNITGYKYTDTHSYSEYGGKRAFANIPEGVTVTVAENNVDSDSKVKGYTYKGVFTRTTTTNEDETVTTTDASFNGLTIADDTNATNAAIVVTNEKTASVETGVSLDTVPYFLMLAVACVGMFLLLSKKRAYREN